MDNVIVIVSTICGVLTALIAALIPILNAKYRKPLQQAQIAIKGVNDITSDAVAKYRIDKAVYDAAVKQGNAPAAVLQSMAAQVATDLAAVIKDVQSTIAEVKK